MVRSVTDPDLGASLATQPVKADQAKGPLDGLWHVAERQWTTMGSGMPRRGQERPHPSHVDEVQPGQVDQDRVTPVVYGVAKYTEHRHRVGRVHVTDQRVVAPGGFVAGTG